MCPVDNCAPGGPDVSGEMVRLRSILSGTSDRGLEPGSSETVANWLFLLLLLFNDRRPSFCCFSSSAAASNDGVNGCLVSKFESCGSRTPALSLEWLYDVDDGLCFFRWRKTRRVPTMMRRIRAPPPTPMPILVARPGPLSGEAVGAGNGGATGRPSDVDEDAGATKDVLKVELEDVEKTVVGTESDGVSVSELLKVVDCCKLVLAATVVDVSETEDIGDGYVLQPTFRQSRDIISSH
jgi:hypothetical protein